MLTAERRRSIMQMLQRDGKVQATELSKSLHVSEDTIRRDLRELASAGMLQRVHGGALPRTPASASFTERQQQAADTKSTIARAAIRLIRRDSVVILDSGTTLLQVALNMPRDLRATIVTHSPPIAAALSEYPEIEVIVIGGRLDKQRQATIGAATVEAYHAIRADLCLLGIRGLHPDVGISVHRLEEAYVKRAMIASAAEVVALSSAEKLGTAAPYIAGSLSDLTQLVTDRSIPDDVLALYKAQGITVVRA